MPALTRTRAVGGSLIVTIPKKVVESEGLEENQLVEIEIRKKKIDGFGALKGIGSYNRKEDRARGQLDE